MKKGTTAKLNYHLLSLPFIYFFSSLDITSGNNMSVYIFPLSSLFSLSQFVVIASTLTSSGLKYDEYIFPNWSNLVGWGIAMSSMVFVPSYAIYKFFSLPGTFREVSIKISSSIQISVSTALFVLYLYGFDTGK